MAKIGSGANRRATSGSAVSATSTTATASRDSPSSTNLPRPIAASEKASTATAMRASSRNCLLRRVFTALEGSEARARRVAPGEDPCPPWGGRRSSSLRALWRRVARSYRGGMTENTHLVVETQDLGKRYGERIVAVDGLNLEVRRGEVYGFLGPNGAGKTTTLRMLLGLIRPTTGAALVLGARPGTPEGLGRVGALIETPTFYPYLSGRDNLRVLARYAGVSETRIAHGARRGRPDRPGRRPLPDLLARDEAAPRHRRRPAQGPRAPHPRRADQRHGPGRHRRDAPLHPQPRPGRPHRPALQPPDERGRAGLRPRRRHQPRQARQRGNRRRAPRPRGSVGARRAARRGRAAARVAPRRRRGRAPRRRPPRRGRAGRASTINRALVEAGIAVSELRPDRASLEKVFLELTNEEEAA